VKSRKARSAAAEKTAQQQGKKLRGRPFPKGKSGNPAGRPKGALNRSSRIAAALLDGEAEKLARKAVELALAGDPVALKLCLERLIPQARENSINLEIPVLKSPSDLPAAINKILAAIGGGEITPGEGRSLVDLFSGRRAASEFADVGKRLDAVEGVI
jgi:hypothetical protein